MQLDPDPNPHWKKMPDPQKINADPQPWLVGGGGGSYISAIYLNKILDTYTYE